MKKIVLILSLCLGLVACSSQPKTVKALTNYLEVWKSGKELDFKIYFVGDYEVLAYAPYSLNEASVAALAPHFMEALHSATYKLGKPDGDNLTVAIPIQITTIDGEALYTAFNERYEAELVPLFQTDITQEKLFEAYYTLLDEVTQTITTTKTITRIVYLTNNVGTWKIAIGEDDYDLLDAISGGFFGCLNQSSYCGAE